MFCIVYAFEQATIMHKSENDDMYSVNWYLNANNESLPPSRREIEFDVDRVWSKPINQSMCYLRLFTPR